MSNNPTKIKSWRALETLSRQAKKRSIKSLFEDDPKRFENFSAGIDGIFFDYSKQNINAETLDLLIDIAKSQKLEDKRTAMFAGEKINKSENRAVLHTALRRPETDEVLVDGKNIISDIHDVLGKMKDFSDQVRKGEYKGATGKQIKHIISIGIGGSDMGPRLVCHALGSGSSDITVDFVSNIDADDLLTVLKKSDPEKTLFLVVSKSFKTQDTLVNATTAKEWLSAKLPKAADIGRHFIAISANEKAAQEFGLSKENFYPIWNWVNGRFSVWSAVGLPICLKYGFETFRQLLDGGYLVDCHFTEQGLEKNIPVLMALISVWNRNFLDIKAQAILPYSQKLNCLPAYLRQQDMESNGKTVNSDGEFISCCRR
ncbi:MAG TPA: hypothetical protein PLF01_07935 [Alphaproteobacteria bacterium]|nr:hypothetical protein [Alphaproteobacteria bacterium]